MKVAFDENIPMAMVRVFQTFASERQLKKLVGNFIIQSAKDYTPQTNDDDYEPKNDVPWIRRFAKAGGRVIISGNTDMKAIAHERLALIECGMVVIFFEPRWNGWGFFEKCAHLMHWWPVIAAKARRGKKGTFWHVPLNWTAQANGRLRAVSNRDPKALKLERRAKGKVVPDKKASTPKKFKKADDVPYRVEDLFTYASRRNNGKK